MIRPQDKILTYYKLIWFHEIKGDAYIALANCLILFFLVWLIYLFIRFVFLPLVGFLFKGFSDFKQISNFIYGTLRLIGNLDILKLTAIIGAVVVFIVLVVYKLDILIGSVFGIVGTIVTLIYTNYLTERREKEANEEERKETEEIWIREFKEKKIDPLFSLALQCSSRNKKLTTKGEYYEYDDIIYEEYKKDLKRLSKVLQNFVDKDILKLTNSAENLEFVSFSMKLNQELNLMEYGSREDEREEFLSIPVIRFADFFPNLVIRYPRSS